MWSLGAPDKMTNGSNEGKHVYRTAQKIVFQNVYMVIFSPQIHKFHVKTLVLTLKQYFCEYVHRVPLTFAMLSIKIQNYRVACCVYIFMYSPIAIKLLSTWNGL